jgi:hypothetical protein
VAEIDSHDTCSISLEWKNVSQSGPGMSSLSFSGHPLNKIGVNLGLRTVQRARSSVVSAVILHTILIAQTRRSCCDCVLENLTAWMDQGGGASETDRFRGGSLLNAVR